MDEVDEGPDAKETQNFSQSAQTQTILSNINVITIAKKKNINNNPNSFATPNDVSQYIQNNILDNHPWNSASNLPIRNIRAVNN